MNCYPCVQYTRSTTALSILSGSPCSNHENQIIKRKCHTWHREAVNLSKLVSFNCAVPKQVNSKSNSDNNGII